MNSDEYKCSCCQGVFQKGMTDEEAAEELKQNFGSMATIEESELVCDDCYNVIMGKIAKQN